MDLCDVVRETAYAIHVYHGHGHLEKVYENALAHRLRKADIEVAQQLPLTVYDEDGTILGDTCRSAGRWATDRRAKSLPALADEHMAQMLGYLKSARIEDGLLINFGSFKFQIKKYILSHERTEGTQGETGRPPR